MTTIHKDECRERFVIIKNRILTLPLTVTIVNEVHLDSICFVVAKCDQITFLINLYINDDYNLIFSLNICQGEITEIYTRTNEEFFVMVNPLAKDIKNVILTKCLYIRDLFIALNDAYENGAIISLRPCGIIMRYVEDKEDKDGKISFQIVFSVNTIILISELRSIEMCYTDVRTKILKQIFKIEKHISNILSNSRNV